MITTQVDLSSNSFICCLKSASTRSHSCLCSLSLNTRRVRLPGHLLLPHTIRGRLAVRRLWGGAASCRLLRREKARKGATTRPGTRWQPARESISQCQVLIFRIKDYSRRSIAVDDQSGPIGAGDAILHRERVSKSGGSGDIYGRTLWPWQVFRRARISAVAGYTMSRCRRVGVPTRRSKMEGFRYMEMVGEETAGYQVRDVRRRDRRRGRVGRRSRACNEQGPSELGQSGFCTWH